MPERPMLVAWVMLFALSASGQDSVSSSSIGGGFSGSAHFGPAPRISRPVTGAPYSGELVTENVQTLADGTHITRTMPPTKEYRDSFGRTRTERPMFRQLVNRGEKAPDAPTVVEIVDPVAQVRYTLDTQKKVAHKQALVPMSPPSSRPLRPHASPGGAAGHPAAGQSPASTTEKLEPQTIEGLPAVGTRRTTTWPEGAVGNDRPITAVSETWMSPELQAPLLTRNADPRFGEHTEKLIGISRAEPDASLFQPPVDYTVVDEKEDFTITWGAGSQ